ncbi:hypothetical protein KUL25_14810 [Rhodobacteraceae bacterium N5(2021)]|uniref:Uncharacterized protein n=1 Tax=Gymnodinialimonas phycosphaerae TaxID=2841589 RepID=A0A975TSV9_9RHOB|nr:hypothetical protein [Gymnodinialimonas phycosphaerae]MBY4894027.1 hypothetical protein [Gymnodinialimonas phycosphaerae]
MTSSITKALRLATAAAVLAAATLSANAQTFDAGYIQTLDVTSTRGASQMHQIFNAGTGGSNPAITRVCIANYGNVGCAFTHTVRGINPLVAQPGSQSCANFSSNCRVAFGMFDGLEPAQANRAMVMNLSAFAGGTVSFIWQ